MIRSSCGKIPKPKWWWILRPRHRISSFEILVIATETNARWFIMSNQVRIRQICLYLLRCIACSRSKKGSSMCKWIDPYPFERMSIRKAELWCKKSPEVRLRCIHEKLHANSWKMNALLPTLALGFVNNCKLVFAAENQLSTGWWWYKTNLFLWLLAEYSTHLVVQLFANASSFSTLDKPRNKAI